MSFDFISDWPAYVFIGIFIFFVTYVIVKGNSGDAVSQTEKTENIVKKK
ncbi:MAG: hypothetical protein LBO62_02550 [Endomicrobium sp.]|jgi:hypothetical protein|nr:hypothetical protein [Endomicrobium sp.]